METDADWDTFHRRLNLTLAGIFLITGIIWTWIFIHFDLTFGLGIDIVLILLTWKAVDSARPGHD